MKIVFLDTETTSLHEPFPLQLGIAVCDEELNIINACCTLVKCGHRNVDPYAYEVHGITGIKANRYGIADEMASMLVHSMLDDADLLVGFNLDFDMRALQHLNVIPQCDLLCTMKASKPHVKALNVKGALKNPKLIEAFQFYTGQTFSGGHDALNDALATREIYRKMRELKHI
jgi:DNA polymerase-3 subunit epsilon